MKIMKYIFRVLMVLSVVLFFTRCEKDENGRMPDNIQDSNIGVLSLADNSDYLIDRNDFGGFNFDIVVDALFDYPFDKLTVRVVYNGDYANPKTVAEVTSVPSTITVTVADLVSLFDQITTADDIKEGDSFDFYTDITLSGGKVIPGYLSDGTTTAAPSVRNVIGVLKGGNASVHLPVPCPFVEADYLGDAVDALEHWNDNSGDAFYPVSITKNADLSSEGNLVIDIVGLFTGDATSTFQLDIDTKTYQISAPGGSSVVVVNEDLFGWGYGRLFFDDFTEPLLGTCEGYIRFTVTPSLNDTGLWWGTTVTYYLGPGAGDVTFKKAGTANEAGYGVLRDRLVKKM
jgi:hypothetical protein